MSLGSKLKGLFIWKTQTLHFKKMFWQFQNPFLTRSHTEDTRCDFFPQKVQLSIISTF